jgi:hypothetical protein
VLIVGLLGTGLLVVVPAVSASATGPNLAAGKPVAVSSANGPYVASNLDDGDPATYWESANNAFPQWAQVDLGSGTRIDQLVLKLPPTWGTRTETLAVQGSPDGTTFSTIVAPTGYAFDPAAGNVVSITFGATTTRFVRLSVSANTGWPAAQISEFEAHGAATSTNLALGRAMAASGFA